MPDQHDPLREAEPDTSGFLPTVRVQTRALATPVDHHNLVDHVPAGESFHMWGNDECGLVAWGETTHVHTTGVERFHHASAWFSELHRRAQVEDEVDRPGTGLLALGSFTFSGDSAAPSVLMVPHRLVGYDTRGAWSTTVSSTTHNSPGRLSTRECTCVPSFQREHDWDEPVRTALQAIAEGTLDKVVLARAETHHQELPWDQRAIVRSLLQLSPSTWTYACAGLLGSTPEMLVRARHGSLFSRVLAGTKVACGPEDRAAHHTLLESSKDMLEHRFAVDSVVEALAGICSRITASPEPFVLGLPHVAHLASDIHATMAANASVLHVVDRLQPTAAVCGTPTPDAARFIAQHEPIDRRRYAGAVGWIDGKGNADWGLALRCGQTCEEHPTALTLYAGCGIVAGSTIESEYEETLAKLQTMGRAIVHSQQ